MGWSPPSRSMIASRRAASPASPTTASPPLSGPRWRSVALMAANTSRSGARASVRTMPQMPHMSVGHLVLWAPRGRDDDQQRLRDDLEVQPQRAVGDVLEVVRELLRPRHLTGQAQLREPGDPGRDDQALPVGGDLLRQTLEEEWADRARADDAHVPAQHVPE